MNISGDKAGDLVFKPSWDWTGLRIVEIEDSRLGVLADDLPLEASGEDLGLIAHSVLRGQILPIELLHEAERQGVKVDPKIAAWLRGSTPTLVDDATTPR
jgi:hypothetical protein